MDSKWGIVTTRLISGTQVPQSGAHDLWKRYREERYMGPYVSRRTSHSYLSLGSTFVNDSSGPEVHSRESVRVWSVHTSNDTNIWVTKP